MSEVLILHRAGPALRVRVERRPGPRAVRLVLRMLREGAAPRAVARRLRLRRAYVERLGRFGPAPAVQAAALSWTALVAREARAVEREVAA